MKLRDFISKTCTFLAGAMSEPTGERSSRRLVMVAAIFAGIAMAFILLVKNPEMAKGLMEFIIINAIGVYFGTRVADNIAAKNPPAA